jgi:hypothetical protein
MTLLKKAGLAVLERAVNKFRTSALHHRPNRTPPLRLYLPLIVCLAFRFSHKITLDTRHQQRGRSKHHHHHHPPDMTRKNHRRQHNSSPRPSPYDTADRRRLPYNERRIHNENCRVLDDNRLILDDDRRSGQREDEHPHGPRIDSKSRRRRDRGSRNGPPWPPKVNASTDRYTPQYQQENSRSLPKTPGTNGTTPSVPLPAAIRERNAALPQREPSRPDAPAAAAAYEAAYEAAAPVSGGDSCPRAGPVSTAHPRTGPD